MEYFVCEFFLITIYGHRSIPVGSIPVWQLEYADVTHIWTESEAYRAARNINIIIITPSNSFSYSILYSVWCLCLPRRDSPDPLPRYGWPNHPIRRRVLPQRLGSISASLLASSPTARSTCRSSSSPSSSSSSSVPPTSRVQRYLPPARGSLAPSATASTR